MIHVLQIEDSPTIVHLTKAMLAESASAQFELESVETLAEGVVRVAKGGVDVVLLDLTLPDGQGLETFSKFHTAVPNIPVVIYTSVDDEELSLEALQQGAADYLVKSEVHGKWLRRSLTFAMSRHPSGVAINAKTNPEKEATKKAISIQKTDDSSNAVSVLVHDKRLVDVVAMEAIKSQLLNLVRQSDCEGVRIDFSQVDYVANAAISMLLIVNKKARAASKPLVFDNVSPQVYEQFSSRRFDKVFQIEKTQA